jgi:hypothetical protein
MKITKERLQQIIKEEVDRGTIIQDVANWMNDNGRYNPNEETINAWWGANSRFYDPEKEQEIKQMLLQNADEIEEMM